MSYLTLGTSLQILSSCTDSLLMLAMQSIGPKYLLTCTSIDRVLNMAGFNFPSSTSDLHNLCYIYHSRNWHFSSVQKKRKRTRDAFMRQWKMPPQNSLQCFPSNLSRKEALLLFGAAQHLSMWFKSNAKICTNLDLSQFV